MDILRRGPVYRTDSDSEGALYSGDSKQKYEDSMRKWREQAREEAFNTAQLSPEFNAVQRYVQALQGDWWERRRARYKSKFYDNRLDNTRQSDLALLTNTRPTIDVSTNVEAYKEQAAIVQKIIQSEWTANDMDISLITATDIAKLNGTGFWKIGAALPGRMQVVPCGPDSVLPIQPGFNIQQSTAVLYKTWKALAYFRNKFPYNYEGLENESNLTQQSIGGQSRFNRPSDIPEYTWNGLSPQMKRVVGVQTESSDMQSSPFRSVELQEFYVDDPSDNESRYPVLMRNPYVSLKAHNYWYWVKPGQRLYPRKRLIVYGGRKLMYDGPSPFWHGLYPFACMRLNPVPWSFWGLSKYRNLLPLNQGLNEIGSGILDMIKRALNPVAVTKIGAVPPATWREFYPDMPGARLQMLANANPMTDLRYMSPPEIPAWVLQFHNFLSTEFDRLSGSIDVAGLGRKKQIPGGDTIEQMRNSLNTVTQLEERYLEVFLRDAGVQSVSNAFQHYELPIRLKLLGDDGLSSTDADYNGPNLIPDGVPKEDHWRNFAMNITPGSALGGAKDREKQVAISLATHGLLPVQELYRTLGISPSVYKEFLEERESGLIAQSGRGARGTRGQRNGKAA